MTTLKKRKTILALSLCLVLLIFSNFISIGNKSQQKLQYYINSLISLQISSQKQATFFIPKIQDVKKYHRRSSFSNLSGHNSKENLQLQYMKSLSVSHDISSEKQESFFIPNSSNSSKYHPRAPIYELSGLPEPKILIEPDIKICQIANIKNVVLVIILNRLSSVMHRYSIRSTYINTTSFVKNVNFNWTFIFLTGRAVKEEEFKLILEESRNYSDILMTNIEERYLTPTTLKMFIAYEFLFKKCSNIRYVVKTDDDVYLQLPQLETAIEGQIGCIIEQFPNQP